MPKFFWYVLWISQVINWIVTIWAYGTPDGSCLLAPLFTIVWVLKDEIAECFRVIFTDEYEFEDEEGREWNGIFCREKVSYLEKNRTKINEGTKGRYYGISGKSW